MGLLDRFTPDDSGGGSGSDENWQIWATAEDGTRHPHPDELDDGAWVFEDPPTEQQFKFQWGELLDPGIKYVCCPATPTGPDFERIEWSFQTEPPRRDRDTAEELAEVVRRESSPTFEDIDDIEAQLIWEMRQDQGADAALDKIGELKRSENASDHSFLESADLGDNGQILKAFLADMSKNYGSVGDVVDDVFGSLMQTAAGHARVGPTAQLESDSGQQQAQQEAQEPAEPAPRPAPRSPAEEAFKTAADAEDMQPEERLDLGAEPDAEARSEMERELVGDDVQEDAADRDDPADRDDVQDDDADATAEVEPGNMSAAPAADGGAESDPDDDRPDLDDVPNNTAVDDDPDDAQEVDA